MASVSVYNKEGKEVEKIDLNDSVFAAPVNEHLVHMAVVFMLDRVPSVLHSGQAAALCSHRFREIILSK